MERQYLLKEQIKVGNYSFWAVVRKKDNKFLGICGLLKQEIDGQVEAEIGYRLIDSFWCKGYGTEAAKGCVEYAKKKLMKESLIALIRSVNLASIRVAEKNGLRFEKETIFCDLPHRVYRLKFKNQQHNRRLVGARLSVHQQHHSYGEQ